MLLNHLVGHEQTLHGLFHMLLSEHHTGMVAGCQQHCCLIRHFKGGIGPSPLPAVPQARHVQADAAGSIQLRILAGLQNQAVATAWETWLQFHHRQKACRVIAHRISHKGLAAAFNAWRDWSAQMGKAKQMCRRLLGGVVQRCFHAWE